MSWQGKLALGLAVVLGLVFAGSVLVRKNLGKRVFSREILEAACYRTRAKTNPQAMKPDGILESGKRPNWMRARNLLH
jgi:hypothetical protein